MNHPKPHFLTLSIEDITALGTKLGWKPYRISQVLAWVYKRYVTDIDAMSDLSKADRILLDEAVTLAPLEIVSRQLSVDGTEKFLFALADGKQIETVLIRDESRRTLCISSQVGCTLDCTFCLTAQMGLKRNLRSDEILNQILTVQSLLSEDERIGNIVLMGMGEPIANLSALQKALVWMISQAGFDLASRRVTVSTAGMVPQIEQLLAGPVDVNLSISLNATTDAVRDRLMPKVNRLYPLKVLLAACRHFKLPPRRSITFEYVMFDGLNDSLEDAARLIVLTKDIRCKINLIPFNHYPGAPYQCSSDEAILRFQNHLLQAKVRTTIRKSKGQDILAACGQLKGQFSTS